MTYARTRLIADADAPLETTFMHQFRRECRWLERYFHGLLWHAPLPAQRPQRAGTPQDVYDYLSTAQIPCSVRDMARIFRVSPANVHNACQRMARDKRIRRVGRALYASYGKDETT